MKDYFVFERMTTITGDEYDELVEVVTAKNKQSAVNKAYAGNKVKAGDVVPPYRRQKENFWAKPIW